MRSIKVLAMSLVCTLALAASASARMVTDPQNSNSSTTATTQDACCDMEGCCKDMKTMSCCKKKRKGKNAHACCKGKDKKTACCCKGDACPMPNKKAAAPATVTGN
jgi:hypothetical protein